LIEAAMLEPDRDQLEIFVEALFRRAGDKGFVAVHSFYEGADKPFRLSSAKLSGGLRFLIEVAEDDARRAAQSPAPVVFCPPLAVFANKDKAREQDLLEGLALSVECDQHPGEARAILEDLLGPATVVVRSGGTWVNGGNMPEDKLHLHWRLKAPATGEALATLKLARDLASRLAGGIHRTDPSVTRSVGPVAGIARTNRACARSRRSTPTSKSNSRRRWQHCKRSCLRSSRRLNPMAQAPAIAATGLH
jgi:hypothetical protein